MSLLSHTQLLHLAMDDRIIRTAEGGTINPDAINATSIDITLGNVIMVERRPMLTDAVDIAKRDKLHMQPMHLDNVKHWSLLPGEFVLAQSAEFFFLPPNISAEYKLKSSMARNGMEHLNAGWCDAGWHGSVLTLELKNMTRYHSLLLTPGMPIGQVVFWQHEPVLPQHSYAERGRYNNDACVTQAKP